VNSGPNFIDYLRFGEKENGRNGQVDRIERARFGHFSAL
jgi:hypothetical protein